MRGHGTKIVRRRRMKRLTPKSYTINFKYSNRKGDGESVIVISTDYHKALDEAFEEKTDKREPIEVEVIDPALGRVMHAVGSGVKKLGKFGAKYSVKGAHLAKRAGIVAGKVALKGVKFAGKPAEVALKQRAIGWQAKKLLTKCYTGSKAEQILARRTLKREFPDVYDICDFSKPDRVVRVEEVRMPPAPSAEQIRKSLERERELKQRIARLEQKDLSKRQIELFDKYKEELSLLTKAMAPIKKK